MFRKMLTSSSKQIECTKFSVKLIYIKKCIKNINMMFRKTFTSSDKIYLSVFDSSFVDSILKIQNINSFATF